MKHIFIYLVWLTNKTIVFGLQNNLYSSLHKTPLHFEKVTVWCGDSSFDIFGLYFFEENNVTLTVTSEHYVEILNNLPAELLRCGVQDHELWF